MKALFEHPMYQGTRAILVFLCLVVFVADLLGCTPDNFLQSGMLNALGMLVLLPYVAEDWYHWWQKKKLSQSK